MRTFEIIVVIIVFILAIIVGYIRVFSSVGAKSRRKKEAKKRCLNSMNKIFNVGLVGCGHISETYFRAEEYFNNIKIIKCADINSKIANDCAKKYNIQVGKN